jgi:ankyrin repeat protein
MSVGLFLQGIMAAIARPGVVHFGDFNGLHALDHRDIIPEPLFSDILRYRLLRKYEFVEDVDIRRVTRAAVFLVEASAPQLPKYQVKYRDAVYAFFVAESRLGGNLRPDDYERLSSEEKRKILLLDALTAVTYLGNVPMVQHLLNGGAELNSDGRYCRPVIQAASQGHLEIFRMLLLYGAEVDKHEQRYQVIRINRALNRASSFGHLDIIKLLLTRPTFLLGEYENRTDVNKRLMPRQIFIAAIKHASKGGHRVVIEFLVQQMGCDGYEPLKDQLVLHAVLLGGIHGSQEHIVRWILDFDIDININRRLNFYDRRDQRDGVDNDFYDSVLERAALHGRPSIVQLLLNNGVDRNTQALAYAATNGHVEVAKLLLDYPSGGNIEHVLVGVEDFGAGESSVEKPLYGAAANGHVPMLKFLLERGKDINVPWTEEACAMARSNTEAAVALQEAGVDIGNG